MAAQPEVAALAERYQIGVHRILSTAGRVVGGMWLAAGTPDDSVADATVPFLQAAQARVASLADAYVTGSIERLGEPVRSGGIDIERFLLSGGEEWLRSPALRWRARLAQGVAPEEAARIAAEYARELAEYTVRNAERQAARESFRTHWRTGKPMRFIRIPSGGACGFCRVVASKIFSAAAWENDDGGWHKFCRCSWAMAVDVSAAEAHVAEVRGTWEGRSSADAIKEKATAGSD